MVLRAVSLGFAAVLASAWGQDTTSRPSMEEWQGGQAEQQAASDAEVAKQKKMAAVDKVVQMLESLQKHVIAEGEEEAHSYDKFACFCKDTTKEKIDAIKKNEDTETELVANINEMSTTRTDQDKLIQDKQDEIVIHQKEQQAADGERAATKKLYDTNAADLAAALDALTGAIQTLKASKTPPSFAQIQSVSETVRTALTLADALGVGGAAATKAAALLQDAPKNEVQMQDYDFHSDGIIKTLEKLLDDFRAEKVTVDEDEVKSVKEYDEFTQTKTHAIKMANEVIEKTRKAREDTIAEIEATHQRLATIEATLLEDKEYAKKLSDMCSDKAKTWDQRSTLRAAEISTLTQAIGIIKGAVTKQTTAATMRLVQQGANMRLAKAVAHDASAMEAIEREAEAAEESQPLSFVQIPWKPSSSAFLATAYRLRGSQKDGPMTEADGKEAVVNSLRKSGAALHSTLLTSLATKIATDPFAKVKVLIQELIERLLQEAANEANHKGWCDNAMTNAQQRCDYAAEEIATLNSELEKENARKAVLAEEHSELMTAIQELEDARDTAVAERSAESTQNANTIAEAQAGVDAISSCIELLDQFYKASSKATVPSLVQANPEDEAPDAGFDSGEAYLGAQSESGGILGMLDVMKSDFVRTIEETQLAEERAKRDHLEFMTETGKSLAQKNEAATQVSEQLTDATQKYNEADTSFKAETQKLLTAIAELLELKPVCVDTGMSYEDRVARREDEIQALNKAMCILERYAEYGPEGAADSC